MKSYKRMPAGFRTNTAWCHVGWRILNHASVRGNSWFRNRMQSYIITDALREAQYDGFYPKQRELAVNYAIFFMRRTGLIKRDVRTGMLKITDKGLKVANDQQKVLWTLFSSHRRYASKHTVKTLVGYLVPSLQKTPQAVMNKADFLVTHDGEVIKNRYGKVTRCGA